MKVYFATDHAGFELKSALIPFVQSLGYEVEDCGALQLDPEDDYPQFVAKAAKEVSEVEDGSRFAVVIGASGQGEAIMSNRFKHVRAAVYYGGGREQKDASGKTLDMIVSARVHNNANVLSLGARFIDEAEAKRAVEAFLTTPFTGEERHKRRLALIDAYAP